MMIKNLRIREFITPVDAFRYSCETKIFRNKKIFNSLILDNYNLHKLNLDEYGKVTLG